MASGGRVAAGLCLAVNRKAGRGEKEDTFCPAKGLATRETKAARTAQKSGKCSGNVGRSSSTSEGCLKSDSHPF